MPEEHCSWCGVEIDRDDGWRASEHAGGRYAAFCRLEHVVAWVLRGAHWEPTDLDAAPADAGDLGQCAVCEVALDDSRVVLVHHRGPHRIADAFCGTTHLRQWAAAGGRWA